MKLLFRVRVWWKLLLRRFFVVDSFCKRCGVAVRPKMIRDPSLLFVQRLPETTETTDLINWVIALGAGEGVAALTLEKSTRTSPFTVQSIVGPDGNLQYYLSDATSVATYGQIEKIISFKQIAPLSNSETDIINAANALFDAAAEWLTRHRFRCAG